MRYYSFIFGLAIIGAFFIQILIPGFTDRFLLTPEAFSQPWRFVTAIFLHGSVGHLLYNLFALLLFGFILESLAGSRKFLMIFFVTGILANLFSVFFYPSALGASGAIFGIIGTLTVMRPLMTVWAFSLPMPLFVASMVWATGDIIGVFVPSGTANLAHLSGLAIGLIIGFFLISRRSWRKHLSLRHSSSSEKVKIPEDYARRWEDRFMR